MCTFKVSYTLCLLTKKKCFEFTVQISLPPRFISVYALVHVYSKLNVSNYMIFKDFLGAEVFIKYLFNCNMDHQTSQYAAKIAVAGFNIICLATNYISGVGYNNPARLRFFIVISVDSAFYSGVCEISRSLSVTLYWTAWDMCCIIGTWRSRCLGFTEPRIGAISWVLGGVIA